MANKAFQLVRRRALLFCGLISLLGHEAFAQTGTITTGTATVELHTIVAAGQISEPDFLTTSGVPRDSRLFAVSQNGQVRIIKDGSLDPTPFFNASTAPNVNLISGGELGLLGLAFSPDFSSPTAPGYHKVYTFTSERANSQTPDFTHPELPPPGANSTQTVIREWKTDTNANVIDTVVPSRVLMRIEKPQDNHNGGSLVFGPDKYLYISLGDGGGGNDNNGSDPDGHSNAVGSGPPGNAQDITNVFGKILRIDPLKPNAANPNDPVNDPNSIASANGEYQVPKNNPFALDSQQMNKPGVDEIYAYGLRNPYRISFDKKTGKLYAADVGQGLREEIDVIQNGGNYGWVLKEGSRTNASGTTSDILRSPIGEYTHVDGVQAVIGGYVSRNTLDPNLYGKYIFGDLNGTDVASGSRDRLFYMGINEPTNLTDPPPNTVFKLKISGLGELQPNSALHGFGEGANGELYAVYTNGQIVQFAPLLGDANRDLGLNNADIQALIAAVANPTAYRAAHGNMSLADFNSIADINGDTQVTAKDVAALMNLLAGSGVTGNGLGGDPPSTVPEPPTVWLALLVMMVFVAMVLSNPHKSRINYLR